MGIISSLSPHCTPTTPGKLNSNAKLGRAHAMQKNQTTGCFLPRIPNQNQKTAGTHTTSGPQATWQQSAYEPICTRTRSDFTQQGRKKRPTSTDEGFLHTHLPMFCGQLSVEHHCCCRRHLHARNNPAAV